MLEELKSYSTFTTLAKTQYSEVELALFEGIPAAIKRFHSEKRKNITQTYQTERDVLLHLNGRFRTPRILRKDDNNLTLWIEWFKGDRLQEYLIRKYFAPSDPNDLLDGNLIEKSKEKFEKDNSEETLKLKAQIFSLYRLINLFGVVHGDISYRNIIVSPGDEPKIYIFDFSNAIFSEGGEITDSLALREQFGYDSKHFKQWSQWFTEDFYQSSLLPNGIITRGDGQGSTEKKFEYLGINNLSGNSVLDIGCSEGEICRMVARSGAESIKGLDFDPTVLEVGEKINQMWGYDNIKLQKGNLRNLKNLDNIDADIVFCFSVIHHLLSDKDVLDVIQNPLRQTDFDYMVQVIQKLLEITNKILIFEIPFQYSQTSRIQNVGNLFVERVAPLINGKLYSLGVWKSTNLKDRCIFRIEKDSLTIEEKQKIISDDPIINSWQRSKKIIPEPILSISVAKKYSLSAVKGVIRHYRNKVRLLVDRT